MTNRVNPKTSRRSLDELLLVTFLLLRNWGPDPFPVLSLARLVSSEEGKEGN